MNKTKNMGMVYLVQPSYLVGVKPDRYKIGMSSELSLNRCKSYGDGTIIYVYCGCNDPSHVEKTLIRNFRERYRSVKGSSELFEGDVCEMMNDFMKTIADINSLPRKDMVTCRDCKKKFTTDVYEKHLLRCISKNKRIEQKNETSKTTSNRSANTSAMRCEFCDRYFKNIRSLRHHQKNAKYCFKKQTEMQFCRYCQNNIEEDYRSHVCPFYVDKLKEENERLKIKLGILSKKLENMNNNNNRTVIINNTYRNISLIEKDLDEMSDSDFPTDDEE